MGFKIGNEVSKDGITKEKFEEQFTNNGELKQKAGTIFDKFNTNKTANAKNEQVLDQDEQVSLMAYLKGIAGDDDKITKKEVKNQKKTSGSFLQSHDISYKDLKQITATVSNLLSNAKGKTDAQDDTGSTNTVDITYTTDDDGKNIITTGSGAGITVYTFVQGNAGTKRLDKKTTGQGDTAVTTDLTYGNDGNLSKIKSGGSTVEFGSDGKPKSETISGGQMITIGEHSYPVIDGKVIVNGQTYEVQDGKVAIDGQSYDVQNAADGQKIENSYDSAGNFNKSVVTNGDTVTTTQFNTSGNKSSVTVKEGSGENQKTTVTKYQTDGKTFTSRTITEGQGENQKKTEITYGQGQTETTQTVTQGDKTVVTTYSGYNDDGSMGDDELTKTVTTDKKAHTRETTTKDKPDERMVEILDDSNSKVQKSITFDSGKKTAVITQGNTTVTLDTDNSGNIIAYAKASGTKYETVAEAANRLGLTDTNSEAYKEFIAANGGNANDPVPSGKIKIPSNNTNILRSISADDIDVNAAEQEKSIKNAKELAWINGNITNRKTRGEAAAKKFNSDNSGNKLRQTYATSTHVVYCQQKYDNGKIHQKDTAQANYQQHYVYSPLTGKMEKLEDMINNMPAGQHVKYITQNGYAVLTDESKIKIDFSNFENKMQTKVSQLTQKVVQSNADRRAMRQDISDSMKAMPEMLDVEGNKIAKTGEVEEETHAAETAADAAQTTGGWTQSDWSSYKAPSGYEKTKTLGVVKKLKTKGTRPDRAVKEDQYYYINPDTKSVTQYTVPFGTTEPIEAQVHGAAVLSIKRNNRGGTSAQKMNQYITQNINAGNVVEVLNGYSSLNSGDSSLFRTITSEWLGYGKGHGRDYAVQAHKHIMNKLLEKADEAGVKQNNCAYTRAKCLVEENYDDFISNHFGTADNPYVSEPSKWSYDSDLSTAFNKAANDLITEINKQKETTDT